MHSIRLPVTIRAFKRLRNEVAATVHAVEVAEREWPVVFDVVDWLQEIDDLELPLQ